ncbi:MAG: hypothetical protein M1318_00290 [Firmicutes bacterium]|jgi:hypothetical protein|nr:hypothetical protein [Bacillota bacterium]
MFVESIMNPFAQIKGDVPVSMALTQLKEHPALMITSSSRELVGVVARVHLLEAFAEFWMDQSSHSSDILQRPIRDFAHPATKVKSGTPVEEAINTLYQGEKAVVVLDRHGNPAGLISWQEVNLYLREITGLNDKDSVRFSLALADEPGQLAHIADIVGRAGANITAITLSDPKTLNWVHLVLRVDRAHAHLARQALERHRIQILSEHNE